MRRISAKQTIVNSVWREVKRKRIDKIKRKYGFVLCEFDLAPCHAPDAHHNDGDRTHNVIKNCRLLCREHHRYVTDHNVRDVPDRLNSDPDYQPKSPPCRVDLSGFNYQPLNRKTATPVPRA